MTSSPHWRGDLELAPVLGGHHRGAGGRDAEHLEGHRHGVGGELPAAGAGAGRGGLLQRVQLLFGDLARGELADGLEDLLDGDVVALEVPGADGAAVEHQPGDVQARERHDACRGSSCRSRRCTTSASKW